MDSFPDVPFPHKIFDPVARLLARVGDDVILPIYRRPDMAVEIKPDHTPVTEADGKAEIALRKELAEVYPGAGFIGEETDGGDWRQSPMLHEENGLWVTDRDRTVFIMDPVDGTHNFALGPKSRKPFATMLALFDKGEYSASWVYFPLSRECLFTACGHRSYLVPLNDDCTYGEPKELRVSVQRQHPVNLQFLLYELLKDERRHRDEGDRLFGPMVKPDGEIGIMTCIAECLYEIAVRGTLDCTISTSHTSPWDAWTTAPICQHAGGIVLSESGQHFRSSSARGVVMARDRDLAQKACELATHSRRGIHA